MLCARGAAIEVEIGTTLSKGVCNRWRPSGVPPPLGRKAVSLSTPEDILRKIPLILGVISFILAAVIFRFGTGARRVYSEVFLVILSVIMVANAMHGSQDNKI